MSAPDTKVPKQVRRHFWPLFGSALVALFGVVLIVYWLFEEAAEAPNPNPDGAADPATAPATDPARPAPPPMPNPAPDPAPGQVPAVPGAGTLPTAPVAPGMDDPATPGPGVPTPEPAPAD